MRFIKLKKEILSVALFLLEEILQKVSNVSFIDSTSIAVCKSYRINRHKVFSGLAERGKTTKGWFYGFKLHLIINCMGELVDVSFTAGNTDDRKALKNMINSRFAPDIKGEIFGDRGYISKSLFDDLWNKGVKLVTRVKKNMKNVLMTLEEKILLLKRALIETVFGKIKFLGKFEHSRHRNVDNAFTNLVAALINYQLVQNKPSIISLIKN